MMVEKEIEEGDIVKITGSVAFGKTVKRFKVIDTYSDEHHDYVFAENLESGVHHEFKMVNLEKVED